MFYHDLLWTKQPHKNKKKTLQQGTNKNTQRNEEDGNRTTVV